jgi:hypothetical protein
MKTAIVASIALFAASMCSASAQMSPATNHPVQLQPGQPVNPALVPQPNPCAAGFTLSGTVDTTIFAKPNAERFVCLGPKITCGHMGGYSPEMPTTIGGSSQGKSPVQIVNGAMQYTCLRPGNGKSDAQ